MADLAAQVAANNTGIVEINSMIEQFGIETVHSYMKHVQDCLLYTSPSPRD